VVTAGLDTLEPPAVRLRRCDRDTGPQRALLPSTGGSAPPLRFSRPAGAVLAPCLGGDSPECRPHFNSCAAPDGRGLGWSGSSVDYRRRNLGGSTFSTS
jgi:hypothetical protein